MWVSDCAKGARCLFLFLLGALCACVLGKASVWADFGSSWLVIENTKPPKFGGGESEGLVAKIVGSFLHGK